MAILTEVIVNQMRRLMRRNGIQTLKQLFISYITFVLTFAMLLTLNELA